MHLLHPRIRNAACVFILASVCSMCRKNAGGILTPGDVVEVEPCNVTPVTKQVNASFGGYYIGLPVHYAQTTISYPLIIFLHGLGQMGNGSTELNFIENDGIGKLLKDKKFPASLFVNNKYYSFIVVSPQTSRPPSVEEVLSFIDYIKDTYRIDAKRLYLSGLSLGARIATLAGAESPQTFAAMVPIAGVAVNAGMEERCKSIAVNALPVWAFHNHDDPMADVKETERFINMIGTFNPAIPPHLTIFDVYGHDAWTTALNPAYRENGMNIYEWMLQFSR